MLNLTLFLNQCIISDSFNSEVFVQCRITVMFYWSLTFLNVRQLASGKTVLLTYQQICRIFLMLDYLKLN